MIQTINQINKHQIKQNLIDFNIDFIKKTEVFHHITIDIYNVMLIKREKKGDLPIGRVHAIHYYNNILYSG